MLQKPKKTYWGDDVYDVTLQKGVHAARRLHVVCDRLDKGFPRSEVEDEFRKALLIFRDTMFLKPPDGHTRNWKNVFLIATAMRTEPIELAWGDGDV